MTHLEPVHLISFPNSTTQPTSAMAPLAATPFPPTLNSTSPFPIYPAELQSPTSSSRTSRPSPPEGASPSSSPQSSPPPSTQLRATASTRLSSKPSLRTPRRPSRLTTESREPLKQARVNRVPLHVCRRLFSGRIGDGEVRNMRLAVSKERRRKFVEKWGFDVVRETVVGGGEWCWER